MYPHCPQLPENEKDWFQALIDLARYLRSPEGCPWDREQTSNDFARFAREESDEMVEAFAGNDTAHAREELGDVLFCLLGAAAAAEAEGRFTLEDLLRLTHEKMIRRHDHVFGEQRASTPEEAIAMWNKIKDREKKTK